ncbi:MAG: ABC transporter substrate-binding protein [Spirochaetales bacterium]|nr:ABC transporter substrate-binding protein [Spirochaetales bacterium]
MKKLFLLLTLVYISNFIFGDSIKVAALKGPTGLSMVTLIDSNTQLGTETEYSIVNTPDLVVAGLLSGNYSIAALPTNLAAILYNKKPDYELIAVSGQGNLYVVSNDESIKSWKNLSDKTVYNIARSSTPDFMLNYLLKKNSINANIDFTYNHVELAPMLIAGKVSTGILPEPLVSTVLLKNPKMKVVLDFQKEYEKYNNSSYPLSCIVASKKLITENPEAIKVFLQKLNSSIDFVNSNPEEAGELGNKVGLGVTSTIVKNSISRLNIGYLDSQSAKSQLESYYKILFESDTKSIGGKLPANDFYYDKNK